MPAGAAASCFARDKGAQGVVDRLLFRHDRVWDFFIAAAFPRSGSLGGACRRRAFPRGLPAHRRDLGPRERQEGRDQLNLSAADSGDHSTSDEFIKRLEKRLRTKKGRRWVPLGGERNGLVGDTRSNPFVAIKTAAFLCHFPPTAAFRGSLHVPG